MSQEWEKLAAEIRQLKQDLAEAIRQRDTYKAMLDLQNLRAERAAESETYFDYKRDGSMEGPTIKLNLKGIV